jgi:hypothetical protein
MNVCKQVMIRKKIQFPKMFLKKTVIMSDFWNKVFYMRTLNMIILCNTIIIIRITQNLIYDIHEREE